MTFLKLAKKRGIDTGYVLHINQKPIKSIRKGFRAARDKAGFDDVSPYTLRHTAASWMVQKGIDTFKIARYIGNSQAMIEKHYGHLSPDHLRDVIAAYR